MTTEHHIKNVCKQVEDLLIRKNRSYGDSALKPMHVFSKLPAEEGIKVRIDDKLARLALGTGEFDEDVVLDLLGYLILLRIAQNRTTLENAQEEQYNQTDNAATGA